MVRFLLLFYYAAAAIMIAALFGVGAGWTLQQIAVYAVWVFGVALIMRVIAIRLGFFNWLAKRNRAP